MRALEKKAEIRPEVATRRVVSLNFKVPLEFRVRLKTYAAKEGVTMNDVMRCCVEEVLDRDVRAEMTK